MPKSPTKKLQVSTLQLRKKLEELASPAPRKPKPKIKTESVPEFSGVTADSFKTQPPPKVNRKLNLPKQTLSWVLRSFPSFLLITEITGLILVLYLGLVNLVAPESNEASFSGCQGKISGRWQTRWGNLDLQEDNQGIIRGKFEYKHVDKGLVKGELTGTLDVQALSFDWQEVQANKSVQRGNGLFVFTPDCQEFYGSTPTLGGWQGRRIVQSP